MYAQIPHTTTLGGKRELLQDGEKTRQHFLLVKAGKPDAKIKTVSHKNRKVILTLDAQVVHKTQARSVAGFTECLLHRLSNA